LSVIIPTYGRWQDIGPLLDSVLAQDMEDWECVVCEDGSPNQAQVREVVAGYVTRTNGKVRYFENADTLGYDANFRRLVELARGRFLFVMGDDDFVAPGAFRAVAGAIARYPNLGAILRAFAVFVGTPDNIVQVNRYYPAECRFPAGPQAIVACFRRFVAMSGIVLERELAQRAATDRWDGTVFYQQWLAGYVLAQKDAVYLPDLLAYFRRGGTPIFGRAKAEQGKFTPGVQPPDTDLRMVGALMNIARAVEAECGVEVAAAIERDFANYIYTTLAHQAHVPWPEYYQFYKDLGKLGFARYPQYHAWFWAIAVLGAPNVDRGVQWIRRVLGHTPNLTRLARRGRGA
jgi:glycosyltransferase involved in cell wall biosynthesis